MKAVFVTLVGLLGLCAGVLAEETRLPSEETKARPEVSVYHSLQGYTVTIKSENGLVAVLEIPEGVQLNVDASKDGSPPMPAALELPATFTGDVTVRARRQDEVGPSESQRADEIMARAPLVMELKNVEVLLEQL